MTLRSIVFTFVAIFAMVACGPSAAQIKTARTAQYNTTASAAFQAGVAALPANGFKIDQADPVAGRALSQARWFERDGTSAAKDANGNPRVADGAVVVAFEIGVVSEGSTVSVKVVPHVQQHRDGLSATVPLAEDDPSMPGWIHGMLDNIYLDIYNKLKASAVAPSDT
ncbi:MAG: hypothetical protein R3B06_01290 [Kofleriaceae bacterium]